METTMIFNTEKEYIIANKFLEEYSKKNGLSVDYWMGAGATFANKLMTIYTYHEKKGMIISGNDEISLNQLKNDLIKNLERKAIK
jgi:hypothetical protein